MLRFLNHVRSGATEIISLELAEFIVPEVPRAVHNDMRLIRRLEGWSRATSLSVSRFSPWLIALPFGRRKELQISRHSVWQPACPTIPACWSPLAFRVLPANSIRVRQDFFLCTAVVGCTSHAHNALDLTSAILFYRHHLGAMSAVVASPGSGSNVTNQTVLLNCWPKSVNGI